MLQIRQGVTYPAKMLHLLKVLQVVALHLSFSRSKPSTEKSKIPNKRSNICLNICSNADSEFCVSEIGLVNALKRRASL